MNIIVGMMRVRGDGAIAARERLSVWPCNHPRHGARLEHAPRGFTEDVDFSSNGHDHDDIVNRGAGPGRCGEWGRPHQEHGLIDSRAARRATVEEVVCKQRLGFFEALE